MEVPAVKGVFPLDRLQLPMERRKIKSTEAGKSAKRFAKDQKAIRRLPDPPRKLSFSTN
jgi:hypothetical protein